MAEFLSPAKIGKVLDSDEVGVALHEAAVRGEKRKLKKLLKKGIAVDYPNSSGQTALFCACFEAQEGIVDILLKNAANPNERSQEGSTPCHAAAYGGNTHILCKLVEVGGDLRLHDNKGRTVCDWAQCHADPKRRKKMSEYIEKTRFFAMSHSGRDLLLEKQSSHFLANARDTSSVGSLLRVRSSHSHKSLTLNPSVHSLGYGKIYFGEGDYVGTMAAITLVPESALKHDEYGLTFNNGPFMVMESMQWNKTLVTVKRLHKEPPDGGQVDLLITENEYMAKLRHPNILLLMGICPTNNLEGLVLLYERVQCGSLYTHLYQRVEHLDMTTVCEFVRQMADAVLYLHQQNLLHCGITSHAVQLVSPALAKLGNFEYMVENVYVDGRGPRSSVVDNTYLNATYNWMAPEVMAESYPTEKSDLYSLCAVMWEMLHGMPPWSGMQAQDIKSQMVDSHVGIELSLKVKNPFKAMLQFGLSVEPKGRQLSLEQLRDVMAQISVDRDALQERVTSSPRPYRTWKHALHDVSQDVSSTCDDASDTEAIADTHRARQRLSQVDGEEEGGPSTSQLSAAKYESVHMVRHSEQTDVKCLASSDDEDRLSQVEKVEVTDLQCCSPIDKRPSADQANMAARVTPSGSDLNDGSRELSFVSSTAKRSFFQSTPTSAIPASEAAVIQKSESEGSKEEDAEEVVDDSTASSSSTMCSQHSQQDETGNPFKRVRVSKREIRALMTQPPPPPTMTCGGSSVTLLTKQSCGSGTKSKPTVYSMLRQLSQENSVCPKASELANGAVYRKINYGHFSVTDLKSEIPASAYSPMSRHSVTEGPGGAQVQNESVTSIGSRTSWAGDYNNNTIPLESPKTSSGSVKPASHCSPDRITSRSRIMHYAFPPVPVQSSMGALHTAGSDTSTVHHHIRKTSPLLPYYKRWRQQCGVAGQQPGMATFRSETAVHQMKRDPQVEVRRTVTQQETVAPSYDTPDCGSGTQRASPRQEPEEWYGGSGSIRNLITNFQGQVEEHKKKQAVLCLKSKKDGEEPMWSLSADALELSSPKKNIYNAQKLHRMTDTRVLQCMEGPRMGGRLPVTPSDLISKKKRRTVDMKPSTQKAEVHTRVGPAPMVTHSSPQARREVEVCPGSDHKIYIARHYSDTDQSETDKEVSELVNNVIRNVHHDVMAKYAHPQCPHWLQTNNTEAGHVTNGQDANHPTAPKVYRSSLSVPSSATFQQQKPAPRQSASRSSSGSRGSSHAYESMQSSLQRSGYELGQSTSGTSNRTQQTWSSGYEMVGSGTGGRDLDELSEVSSRKTTDNEIEDLYFDDVIRPEMLKDKHMRLQSAMPLDYSGTGGTPEWATRPQDSNRSASSSSQDTPIREEKITYVKVKRERRFPQVECLYESNAFRSDASGQTVVERQASQDSTPCISEGEIVYPTTSQSGFTDVTMAEEGEEMAYV